MITETIVSFEELIIDVLLLPNGDCHVLDEEELPQPLEHFEKGKVHHDLLELTASLDKLLPMLLLDSESFASHEDITTYLQMNK